ncbi:NUDIX hydrolase, partial [Aspergillus brunneoviolaceus CBS 621.78]
EPEPKTLLLQRSITDSYPGHWENPGGLIDPVRDATVLAGVAREVREETGFHVSRFVDLVCVDEWTKMKRGVLLQETKVTFLVEVREAVAAGWEATVKLAEGEHQAFVWVGEGEVRGVVRDKGRKRKASGGAGRLGVGFINEQGGNVLRGFEVVRGLRGC